MEEHNGFKFGLFVFIVLVIIVGGFVLMQKSTHFGEKDNTEKVTEEEPERKDIRIDKDRDYIYFTDYEVYEEKLDIDFEKVNINFKDSSNIAKTLNDENDSFKANIKKENDEEDAPYDKLSYADYSKYELYTYKDYITLLVKYYNYTTEDFISFKHSKAYVFDLNDGSLVTNDELMKAYNIDEETITSKITEFVKGQDLIKEGEELDPEATVKANKDNLVLYVDKLGKLNASILVKSDKKDYNDSVILS